MPSPADLRTRYLAGPAPCRCTHPADYHRDTYHGDPCGHWLCDCGGYDPAARPRFGELMSETRIAPPRMTVVAHGIEDGIQWATCRAPIYGAVNGYVRIPDGHPWAGLDYDAVDVDVHGGLTYGSDGWIGFDTLHAGDYWPGQPDFMADDRYWTAEQVADETRELARKVAAAGDPR